jgi:DNA-directed RNA polymerase subunit RPC12/RpoP
MFVATSLNYYKRKDVQEALLRHAEHKEIGVMFGLQKFGKRPDALHYEQDVLALAKKKVSSFHCSEELWMNPLAIRTGMARDELDDLRIGWDLILDIDCKDWSFAKITTALLVKALQDHGIKTIGVKFSGNKGFHIIVPYETFPQNIPYADEKGEVKEREVKDLFPEGPRRIALYLLSYITNNYVDQDSKEVVFAKQYKVSLSRLEEIAQANGQSLFPTVNYKQVRMEYHCDSCGHTQQAKEEDAEYTTCSSCNFPVEKRFIREQEKLHTESIFNWLSVVELDTVLISSRHLYRMAYSLHEKSELASVPVALDKIVSFSKQDAKPDVVDTSLSFVDRSKAIQGEANQLFITAFDQTFVPPRKKREIKKLELPTEAVEEKYFPPVIQQILAGIDDGKKRALFILINFLGSCGWGYEQVEQRVYEWNENNPEPLREQYLKGQLSSYKKRQEPLLPPSPTNRDYYVFITEAQRKEYGVRNPVKEAIANKEKALELEKKKEAAQKKAAKKKASKKKAENKAKKKKEEQKDNLS